MLRSGSLAPLAIVSRVALPFGTRASDPGSVVGSCEVERSDEVRATSIVLGFDDHPQVVRKLAPSRDLQLAIVDSLLSLVELALEKETDGLLDQITEGVA